MKINGFGQLHRLLLNENYVINGGSAIDAEEKTAKLMRIVEGVEEVEKMDALFSLAITGGDYNCKFVLYYLRGISLTIFDGRETRIDQ